jgi:drug/metabolite transporter (DMT)-like permease
MQAKRQATWSATANALKTLLERARQIIFGLSILGAVLATLASHYEGGLRWWLAIVGAVVFAIATFLTSRLTDENGGWLAKWTQ